ncbi:hypothetical protein HNY73_018146 [Argiope bruennichi]|uniref:Uncharacterized protein n=1 Tax=Argiope bruennichi TaxID=94029 RepID=A0A8T0EBY6_ARGBR|nr:hypothetical protein HNY73_018146 [Argiope bruennichi]
MRLHKWCFLLANREFSDLNFDQLSEETVKTLGVLWNSSSGTFCFQVSLPTNEKLPIAVSNKWTSSVSSFTDLEKPKIPRFVLLEHPVRIALHGLGDASEKGFSDVVYVSVQAKNDNKNCHCLCSKSRVAQLKTLSIPRLELSACHLLSKVIHQSPSDKRVTGPLIHKELIGADIWLLNTAQNIEFPSEFKNLFKGEPVACNSKLASLNCFSEENNIICVGGRLQNSSLSFNEKCPIVLPSKNAITL